MLVAVPHLELVARGEAAVAEVEAKVAERLLLDREDVALELERLARLTAELATGVELGALAVGRVPSIRRATVWCELPLVDYSRVPTSTHQSVPASLMNVVPRRTSQSWVAVPAQSVLP